MKLGEICNREVIICRIGDSLKDAAKLMRAYHVGSVVVIHEDDGRRIPIGIITDRDILVEVLAREFPLSQVAVGEIMGSELVTIDKDKDVFSTIKMMCEKGVRRLPVVDEWNGLVGIITLDDLLDFLFEEIRDLSKIFSQQKKWEEKNRPYLRSVGA